MRFAAAFACACAALSCGGGGSGAAGPKRAGAPAPASSSAAPTPVVPVPETLEFEAGRFGLVMTAEGWSWKVLRRNLTRFDWTGKPTRGDREVLYAFSREKLDDPSTKLLPQLVSAAAANLTETEPCAPVEQRPEVVQALGVDRVVSVCFEPSTFYGKDHRTGVLHGLVKDRAVTLVAVLSNDRAPTPPLASTLGTHGTPAL